MSFTYTSALRRRIGERLDGFERQPLDAGSEGDGEGLRRAAVAVVVIGGGQDDEAQVLLTRRPDHLNRHGGQFALPGGRLDAGETVVQAALRELDEELGLTLADADVLGRLDDYPTRSGFRISPVVMWGGRAPVLAPDANEVAHVYRIPFHELDSPALPETRQSDAGAHPVLSAPLPTAGGSVYAPTAAVLYQFREVALRGAATRVSHFDQPRFAWK